MDAQAAPRISGGSPVARDSAVDAELCAEGVVGPLLPALGRPAAVAHEQQVHLCGAQVLPGLAGALVGMPAGIYLFPIASDSPLTVPLAQLASVLLATVLAVAALTAIPSHLAARRSVAEILQVEPT